MVVTVMLLSDDSQGPRIGQSFLISSIPVIKNKARQTDQRPDKPSYRDFWMHLKTNVSSKKICQKLFFNIKLPFFKDN